MFVCAGKTKQQQRTTSQLSWYSGSLSLAYAVPTPGTAEKERTPLDSVLATTKLGRPSSDMLYTTSTLYPPHGSLMAGVTFSGSKPNQKDKPILYWRKHTMLNIVLGQTGAQCHPVTLASTRPTCHTKAKIVLTHPTLIYEYHRHKTQHCFSLFLLVQCICPARLVNSQVVLCLPAIDENH